MPSTEYVASEVKNSPNSYRPIVFGQQCETSMNWLRKPNEIFFLCSAWEHSGAKKPRECSVGERSSLLSIQKRPSHMHKPRTEISGSAEQPDSQFCCLVNSCPCRTQQTYKKHQDNDRGADFSSPSLCKVWMWCLRASSSCTGAPSKKGQGWTVGLFL